MGTAAGVAAWIQPLACRLLRDPASSLEALHHISPHALHLPLMPLGWNHAGLPHASDLLLGSEAKGAAGGGQHALSVRLLGMAMGGGAELAWGG